MFLRWSIKTQQSCQEYETLNSSMLSANRKMLIGYLWNENLSFAFSLSLSLSQLNGLLWLRYPPSCLKKGKLEQMKFTLNEPQMRSPEILTVNSGISDRTDPWRVTFVVETAGSLSVASWGRIYHLAFVVMAPQSLLFSEFWPEGHIGNTLFFLLFFLSIFLINVVLLTFETRLVE